MYVCIKESTLNVRYRHLLVRKDLKGIQILVNIEHTF